jgi:hypothetical protein
MRCLVCVGLVLGIIHTLAVGAGETGDGRWSPVFMGGGEGFLVSEDGGSYRSLTMDASCVLHARPTVGMGH